MDYVTAASIPINFGTALRMLETIGRVQKGELVLVIGASGGVGTACIQLCRNLGAPTIAVTRGKNKVAALTALGVDHVLDMDNCDFSKEAWRISAKKGVDVVVNYTGGSTWVPCLRAMRRRGRMITCGATEAFDPKTDIRYIWVRELQILGSTGYTQQDIERAFDIVAAGDAKPVISSVLDISEAREAHRIVEQREVIGKVVLTVPGDEE
jgi:alcohol dehydrogenase